MTRTKADWRRSLLAARASIPEVTRRAASGVIVARLRELPCIREARLILGYVPIGAEVDPMELLTDACRRGVPVLVPSPDSSADAPSWRFLDASRGLDEGELYRVFERGSTVAIVPGVGFDPAGTRLGRGAGFYDRALVRLRSHSLVTVGIAFDVQIVASLPRDEWDQAMDIVLSEVRLVEKSAAREGASRRTFRV